MELVLGFLNARRCLQYLSLRRTSGSRPGSEAQIRARHLGWLQRCKRLQFLICSARADRIIRKRIFFKGGRGMGRCSVRALRLRAGWVQ